MATNKLFRAIVHSVDLDGNDEIYLGVTNVRAADQNEARQKALDEFWDPRLDAASCSPRVEIYRLEESLCIHVPENDWETVGSAENPYTRLNATIYINGTPMHLEAWEVNEDTMEAKEYKDHILDLMEANGDGGLHYHVTQIFGRNYVVYAVPYCH